MLGKLRKTTILSQALRYPEHLANISEALPSGPAVTIIITTITIFITFVHGIYNYTSETTMFLGYIEVHLFCIYNLCYM